MKRHSFLLGHLSGLVLGIALMWLVHAWQAEPQPASNAGSVPAPATNVVISQPLPRDPATPFYLTPQAPDDRGILIPQYGMPAQAEAPRRERTIPPNWQSFEFNGQPVYVIPLSWNDSPQFR